ncbi:hypothetical protein KTN05_02825 [Paracoccus sp. Z118]|uniref:protein-disulfide reductase DsbD domain-containing protein n=1 Tax=Paracoccus sp. Z118 TaxID=2851017 RepID=UPI001C2BB2FE|nr:protein-disulfide reductase DsbD domain-containing protein [Paracoccus sp. Z118]MBV0890782.1 hypothetical protein [Paracoccus sp. Z118]
MNAKALIPVLLCAAALGHAGAAHASESHVGEPPPPGLTSAELLPVQTAPDGSRMTALRLVLEPGWKTYWRSPGDSGVPPEFDWSGSANLAGAQPLWPRPEVIDSGGERTLGYHDELLLPIRLTPQAAGEPVALDVRLNFGLCEDVCVPARVRLAAAPEGDGFDPRIAEALARVPAAGEGALTCHVTDIADGVQVAATIPEAGAGAAAAMELMQDGIWVSQAELTEQGGQVTAVADFVAPSGKPFPLDTDKLRVTLISAGGAVEYRGCAETVSG